MEKDFFFAMGGTATAAAALIGWVVSIALDRPAVPSVSAMIVGSVIFGWLDFLRKVRR